MKAPTLAATIERRLLVNYRVDPAVAATLLPEGLRPQVVAGSAVAGICLIRMRALRPSLIPAEVGWGGEAAAHRIAVEWDGPAGPRTGVYIPRRHSASRLPVIAGGRVLPGVHRRAGFRVTEGGGRYRVAVQAPDETVAVDVRDDPAGWSSRLFPDLAASSAFFRAGGTGWSPDRSGTRLEGLTLDTEAWRVRPATALSVESSFFARLPAGSAVLDHVLLMTEVPVRWAATDEPAPGRPAEALTVS